MYHKFAVKNGTLISPSYQQIHQASTVQVLLQVQNQDSAGDLGLECIYCPWKVLAELIRHAFTHWPQ